MASVLEILCMFLMSIIYDLMFDVGLAMHAQTISNVKALDITALSPVRAASMYYSLGIGL